MADNKRTGLSALADAGDADDFSVIDAIGGPRGVVESMLPGVVFVVMFVITSNLNLTIAVSAVLAVLQVIVRLIQRQSVMGAVSGLVAVGICLIWAWEDSRGPQLLHLRIHYQCLLLCRSPLSLIARVPGLGLVIEFIRTLPTEHLRAWFHDWMDDKALKRAYTIVTGLVGRSVLPTTGGAGAVVPVQPGRLARHCTSAHGHSVLGVGHLGVVPHRGHPHASA